MDYEQKYKEALERAKTYHTNKSGVSLVEYIFHELAESEDEKIRKDLIQLTYKVYANTNYLTCVEQETMLTWLEKQREQKPVEKEFTFKAIPRLLEMIQPSERAKSYCGKLADTLDKEGYHSDANIVREHIKIMDGEKVPMATMDEQKPVEWSEEDERVISKIIAICNDFLKSFKISPSSTKVVQKDIDRIKSWLKSLKDRCLPQPKTEWSEEDELRIENLIAILEGRGYPDYIDWLKSLRPQKQWKPTKEQVDALMKARLDTQGKDYHNCIATLHSKLMELL